MPWPQDDSPLAPQPTPFGQALWKLLTSAVPSQLSTAGNIAAGVARPFTNLFGNGGAEFWQGPQNPQAANDMRQALMTIYGGNALNPAAAETDALGAGIKAYHGSPYDFDRFDSSKIGTGEGAQAYGHGLYFAENPDVAKGYKDSLSGTHLVDDADIARHYPQITPDQAKLLRSLSWENKDPLDLAFAAQAQHPELRDAGSTLEVGPKRQALANAISDIRKKAAGRMYEVNINASPDQFLDWDKPLSEQPDSIKNAVEPIRQSIWNEWQNVNPTLREPTHIGQVLAERGPETAKALGEQGIPGIRYLDQGSRGTGQGTHNYVVFPGNEHLIEIVKKYGLAGAAAAMGMKQADLSQMMGLVGPQNKGTTQ